MIDQLRELAPFVYKGNKSRGFWEDGANKNKDEAVMLMITELSEAVEAHRKNHHYDKTNVHPTYEVWREMCHGTVSEYNQDAKQHFIAYVKDTVEDEIADTVIRILDFTGGFNIDIIERDYRKKSKGNFAADVLTLCKLCIKAGQDKEVGEPYTTLDWGYVLSAIIKFCEWYNIDLMQHIDWKLSYNASRPYKHGKKY